MYKNKERCKKCVYGWLPCGGRRTRLVPEPMCLYFHDTGLHRKGDDNTCLSFKELTQEEIKKRQAERRGEYERNRAKTYY